MQIFEKLEDLGTLFQEIEEYFWENAEKVLYDIVRKFRKKILENLKTIEKICKV